MNETPPPLPDHPVPPAAVSDEFRSRQNWRSFWIVVAVLMALAGGMAMLIVPLVIQVNKKGNRALAISNAKQIGMALFDFDGHVCDNTGNNLLDPANPVWNGKPPVIVYPEMD